MRVLEHIIAVRSVACGKEASLCFVLEAFLVEWSRLFDAKRISFFSTILNI